MNAAAIKPYEADMSPDSVEGESFPPSRENLLKYWEEDTTLDRRYGSNVRVVLISDIRKKSSDKSTLIAPRNDQNAFQAVMFGVIPSFVLFAAIILILAGFAAALSGAIYESILFLVGAIFAISVAKAARAVRKHLEMRSSYR